MGYCPKASGLGHSVFIGNLLLAGSSYRMSNRLVAKKTGGIFALTVGKCAKKRIGCFKGHTLPYESNTWFLLPVFVFVDLVY